MRLMFPGGRGIQLLLVEDSPSDILLFKQAIADFRIPVTIRTALNGEQALMILADSEFHPDLIVLDLNMPRIDGLSFLERYKRNAAPVVIFSSTRDPIELRRAVELGAAECVEKPLSLDEFTKVVSRIIQKWGKPDGNAGSNHFNEQLQSLTEVSASGEGDYGVAPALSAPPDLREGYASAKRRLEIASEAFSGIIRDVPSGIPSPDGIRRIKEASRELSSAQGDFMRALRRLTDHLLGERFSSSGKAP